MSLDNNAIYPTLVSMTSTLENNDNNQNILVYYLLLSHDFNVKNLEIFESLKYHYDFKIKYFFIPNIFTDMDKWRESDTIYYKLLIPLMFPELERMIFLDGDTLIFKDISEMYNLPFNGNFVLGYPFHTLI
jgi:lipopolysaccharide biosynthesis glycosyltransferase